MHARALLLVKRKCKKRKKTEAFKDDVAKNVGKKLINSKKKKKNTENILATAMKLLIMTVNLATIM